MVYSLVHTCINDVDEQASALRDWHQTYDQLSPGPFQGKLEEIGFDQVQIFRETTNQIIHQTGSAWPKAQTLGVPIALDGHGVFCGTVFDQNSLIALPPDGEMEFRTPCRLDLVVVTLHAEALRHHGIEVENRDILTPLQNRRVIPTSPRQVGRLRNFLLTVLTHLSTNPTVLSHPQTRKTLKDLIHSMAIASLSPDPSPLAPAICLTRQQVVAQARDYIQAHMAQPITIADICRELHVSRRTLQYSFQDVLNVSPVGFLRAMRLNQVRRSLRQAMRGEAVADIAARWGFWHLSHFAADYKTMFGELPSDTLRSDRYN